MYCTRCEVTDVCSSRTWRSFCVCVLARARSSPWGRDSPSRPARPAVILLMLHKFLLLNKEALLLCVMHHHYNFHEFNTSAIYRQKTLLCVHNGVKNVLYVIKKSHLDSTRCLPRSFYSKSKHYSLHN